MGRLIILSGPSCVGKSPLRTALERFHPELWQRLTPVVLHNDRAPRPGEKDGQAYHFRQRQEIERLRGNQDFVVMEVRGDLQAIDVIQLRKMLAAGDAFFEGNCWAACALLDLARKWDIDVRSAFMSPLSADELRYLAHEGVSLDGLIADVMRRKLLRRTTKHKGILSLPDLQDIERRATNAPDEMRQAWRFQTVIANHDGEDSENWEGFHYPLGEARKALMAFVDVVEGRQNALTERWRQGDPI
jgi:guanylate kinase